MNDFDFLSTVFPSTWAAARRIEASPVSGLKDEQPDPDDMPVLEGKYRMLFSYVARLPISPSEVTMSVADVAEYVPDDLPTSAHRYREWWYPSGHPHASAWERFGWHARPHKTGDEVTSVTFHR